jgi:HlyD family secretion protein
VVAEVIQKAVPIYNESAGQQMPKLKKGWLLAIAIGGLGVGAALFAWQSLQRKGPGDGFASGNGRIEAVEIDIAAKASGRISEILVNEGDFVTAGQIVARMDTQTLEAELRQAQAQGRQAQHAKATAAAVVAQRKNAKLTAEAAVAQRENMKATAAAVVAQRENAKLTAEAAVAQRGSDLALAEKEFERFKTLVAEGAVSRQDFDINDAKLKSARAALSAAKAQVAEAQSALESAKSQFGEAQSAIEAAKAQVAEAQSAIEAANSQVAEAQSAVEAVVATTERLKVDIDDSALKASRDGRVQYRVAQPGEVLGAGGKVLNLLDLGDVYMTFFLPTAAAGRVAIGSEVRLVLDAAPQYVIPSKVSFVADVAQFTPKTVETASEREKLMFRVKAQIPPDLLKKHITNVKTGLPGMAHVRLDPQAAWPAELQVKLPQ